MNSTLSASGLAARTLSPRAIEHRAAGLGYELKRNQYTQQWHWQIIDSTTLDWRGTGFATKADACRHFARNAAEAGAFN